MTSLPSAGEGPHLKVLCQSGQVLACEEVLPGHSIHGLSIGEAVGSRCKVELHSDFLSQHPVGEGR